MMVNNKKPKTRQEFRLLAKCVGSRFFGLVSGMTARAGIFLLNAYIRSPMPNIMNGILSFCPIFKTILTSKAS